jgi:hypothetical protein
MASPQTPPLKREGLINLLAKSPSLLGEGDLGGEVENSQEKTKELYSRYAKVFTKVLKGFFRQPYGKVYLNPYRYKHAKL